MSFADKYHPKYKENVQTLESEGFRHAELKELPSPLIAAFGATVMINQEGALKAVSHAADQIKDVPNPLAF